MPDLLVVRNSAIENNGLLLLMIADRLKAVSARFKS